MDNIKERTKRTKWFLDSRFGMFIHWGIYAIPARGEWVRSWEKSSIEDYQKYFDEFDPSGYNPREWANAAKDAGMKYAVLTAKHHDGFCLFDSKLTDYKATNTPAGRDLVKEYVEAFREAGIKVGLYYSVIDWHHPDYPAYGDMYHPMRDNEEFKNAGHDFSKYIEYLHGQVKELLTNYGKIDILWFDFAYRDMTGEKWEATKLVNMMRSIQPDIIIDNRLGGNIKSENPETYAGDFDSPERIIPPQGVTNEKGETIPWESCISLNDRWGYSQTDKNFKTPTQIIRTLVECVSKNGNLLLNIGPNAKGEIPQESLEILSAVGAWMKKYGQSIYGCKSSGLEKPEWGRYTRNGNKLYAHILDRGVGPINFRGLAGKIKSARLLEDGSEFVLFDPQYDWLWSSLIKKYPEDAFLTLRNQKLPDESDTVIELNLTDTAK